MAEATHQAPLTANTSGRLKYADPRTLPSFPSSGLRPDGAAASAAATLGWNNQKSIEPWKPEKLSSASAAAVLAKDYKMAPQWEPSSNSAGHKAALLAVDSANSAFKQHSPTKDQHEGWGNSAASQAFNANRPSSPKKSDMSHGSSAATQAFNASRTQSLRNVEQPTSPPADRSLIAAKGAMSFRRPRASSTPTTPRTHESHLQDSAATSALNGASVAHRAALKAQSSPHDAGAVPITTMTRNMFTSNPMVKPEVDERTNNARLHQSAVEMAKKMYSNQQKAGGSPLLGSEDNTEKPSQSAAGYINLQDAAYKQAQERLAKLQDEHEKYYGGSKPRRRFTVSSRLRRKSSDDDLINDREQSEKIRQQMSMFSNKLSEVDQTKRKQEHDALMAAAQRNVKARLHGMDEKVYHETGKVNPTLLSDWELKAQQAAQSRHEGRNENKGKLDLGGGMYMDPNDVDAIAAKRMQPLLDDISKKAEAERERLAALKLEEEARKAELEQQKAREKEIKEASRKARDDEKQEQKAKKQQEKDVDKARKNQEKVEKSEQKRTAKEEKRKSKHDSAKSGIDGSAADDDAGPARPATGEGSRAFPAVVTTNVASDAGQTGNTGFDSNPNSPRDEPMSPTSKVKDWIKNRFSRGKSVGEQDDPKKKRSSFIGGVSLRKSEANGSTTSLDRRASSLKDVALAGKGRDEGVQDRTGLVDSEGVSPISSPDDDARPYTYEVDAASFTIRPPRPIEDSVHRSSASPTRDSRFKEEIDQ
uniref:Eisosome protein 1 n=1 Tax=Bionectria ochroleuca TaxID=29856 RepID=A0A0B7JWE3_BIOOC